MITVELLEPKIIDKREVVNLTVNQLGGEGGGDMYKAVYDTNNDSIVDNSDNSLKLGGVLANQFLKTSDHIDCGTF